MKTKIRILSLFLAVLCLCMVVPNINLPSASAEGIPAHATPGTTDYVSDTDSSDSYAELIELRKESRRAGRVWSDKSVYDTDLITLDMATDGYDGTVENGSDFLHMFSALGSSQSKKTVQALDVMFILDTSASMSSQGEDQFLHNGSITHDDYKINGKANVNKNPRLEYAAEALNDAFDSLMNGSPYNRVGLVNFNLNAETVMPLDRYKPTTVNRTKSQSGGLHNGEMRYLTAAQCSNPTPNLATGGKDANGNALYAPVTHYDDRFQQKKTTSGSVRFVDGQGTPEDWKILEINAISQTTGNNSTIRSLDPGDKKTELRTEAKYGSIPYIHTSSGTDTYWGIYQAMQELANERKTTLTLYKDKSGNVTESLPSGANPSDFEEIIVQRQPMIILVTDGAPNPGSTGSNGYPKQWWTGNPNDVTTKNDIARYDASNAVLVAAIGAYQKQLIEKNYYGKIPTKQEDYGTLVYNVALCIDDANSSAANTAHDGQVALAGLNPKSLNEHNYPYFTTIKNWWNTYFRAGNQYVDLAGTVGSGTYRMTHPSTNDIKSFEALNYNTDFLNIQEPDGLKDAISGLLNRTVVDTFTPVAGGNDVGLSEDSLTYMDPIGKYMEVKNVKKLLLFGEMYDVKKDKVEYYVVNDAGEEVLTTDQSIIDSENYAYSNQYYKIVPKSGDTLINPCYPINSDGNYTTFNLSDITIYVKTTGDYREQLGDDSGIQSDLGSDQTLYVDIPAVALPIQTVTITVQPDGTMVGYDTNIGVDENGNQEVSDAMYVELKKQSTPLRVFYDVGITDDIKTENNNVDLTKVSTQYVQDHRSPDGGQVYFYSNWYNGDKNDYNGYVGDTPYSFGDPVLSFTASKNNRYYLFESSRLLFDNPTGDTEGGIIDVDASGNVSLNGTRLNPITTAVDPDKQYYVMIEYYDRVGLVRYALPRRGSEFGASIGSNELPEYLCWYNPDTEDVKDYLDSNGNVTARPAGGYYVAAKKGGLRVGDLAAGIGVKHNETEGKTNKTGTAQTYYMPTVSSSSAGEKVTMNIYMGNNGKLAVNNTQLLVTKTVNSLDEGNVEALNTEFNYTVKIEDMNDGKYNVINATREANGTWRALIDTINIKTDNDGLIMGKDGQPAVYTDNDTKVQYYIYVGGASAEDGHNFTFFNRKDHSFTEILGSGNKLTTPVTLIPVDGVSEPVPVEDFAIGEVKRDTIGFAISMFYESDINYYTREIEFKDGVAHFTLSDGEGILFNGLDSGADYTVTEILTDKQIKDGVLLQSVTHKENDTNNKEKVTTKLGSQFGEGVYSYPVSGNTTTYLTEEVNYFNYVPRIEKTETWKKGESADIDERLHYQIYFENYAMDDFGAYKDAKVVVTDELDPGVKFVSANYKNPELIYPEVSIEQGKVKIEYDELNHIVTWTIDKAAAKEIGYVELVVKIKETAEEYWNGYDDSTSQFEGGNDYMVLNKASVQVDNHNKIDTEIVKTPVGGDPHKTQTEVKDDEGNTTQVSEKKGNLTKDDSTGFLVGPRVDEDYELTYSISYVNATQDKAKVTVIDQLDPGVDFLSASGSGATLTAPTKTVDNDKVKITYDTASHRVTWEIKEVAPSAEGAVTLKVKVNENAVKGWHYVAKDSIEGEELEGDDHLIFNRGTVQVGNGDAQATDTIQNPMSPPPPPDLPLPEIPTTGGQEPTLLLYISGGIVLTGLTLLFISLTIKKRKRFKY